MSWGRLQLARSRTARETIAMTASLALRTFHNGPLPSQFTSSVRAKLIKVRGGSFVMGSPEDEPGRRAWEEQHEVALKHDYFLGETPVTQGQYAALMGENPTQFQRDHTKTLPSFPWGGSVPATSAAS